MHRLNGRIQHYAWGGHRFIPELLGQASPSTAPCAEYWLGAHQQAPSLLDLEPGSQIALDVYIAQDPSSRLGTSTAHRFGRLPYLFKILDVKDMLSIQVHPSKEEAVRGFERETAAGIPLNAPHRNYKDDNHKPEVMVALSEFWLLHGFLPQDHLRQVLASYPEWSNLLERFEAGGYQGLYRWIMELPQIQVNALLEPLMQRCLPDYDAGRLDKSTPEFWAARAIRSGMCSLHELDRGIFSIFFFNIVRIDPGGGIFQAAGIPHAYLEGQNVELMANSDNVLRGGLTPKHVDVPELLHHIRFEGVHPDILQGQTHGLRRDYPCPVPDFGLSSYRLPTGSEVQETSGSAEILMMLDGSCQMTTRHQSETFHRGEAIFVEAQESYMLSSLSNCLIYKAFVPVD